MRKAGGTVERINAPGAGSAANQGTNPLGINNASEIVGYYLDANNVYHGFLRSP